MSNLTDQETKMLLEACLAWAALESNDAMIVCMSKAFNLVSADEGNRVFDLTVDERSNVELLQSRVMDRGLRFVELLKKMGIRVPPMVAMQFMAETRKNCQDEIDRLRETNQ